MIKTEAGEKMKEENPVGKIDTIDGQELLRQELEKQGKKFGMPEMNMGGLMSDGMGVIIGIEAESGNEIPAGSKPEEVADDIPAMLSEGEYVVPADVVRWHGVKTFEELRCEAKMGMGLMAQDGRIAEVDEEYEHGHESPEYEIEEKDKPKVEKAEVEVVHAAEGVSLEDPTAPTGGPYYGYRVVFDPEAKRYVFKAVDPTTQEYVTTTDYDPTKSTRYMPEALLGIGAEEEVPECPEGFYYDEETGACMPEEPTIAPAVAPQTGGGDGPEDGPFVGGLQNYGSYGIASVLGPDKAYAGKPEAALARGLTPTDVDPVPLTPSIPGVIATVVAGIQREADAVGAHRAIMQRGEDIAASAQSLGVATTALQGTGLTDEQYRDQAKALASQLPSLYNLSYDDLNKNYVKASTYARPTEVQLGKTGKSYIADWEWDSAMGDPLSKDDTTGNWNMSDEEFDSWVETFDDEQFGNLPTTTGTSQSRPGESSSSSGDGGYDGPSASEMDSGSQDQVSESGGDSYGSEYSGPE